MLVAAPALTSQLENPLIVVGLKSAPLAFPRYRLDKKAKVVRSRERLAVFTAPITDCIAAPGAERNVAAGNVHIVVLCQGTFHLSSIGVDPIALEDAIFNQGVGSSRPASGNFHSSRLEWPRSSSAPSVPGYPFVEWRIPARLSLPALPIAFTSATSSSSIS